MSQQEDSQEPRIVQVVNPTTKPAARDRCNRTMVIYRGRRMAYFRAQRIATLEPLINRANSKGMTIPEAAKWLGYSTSGLRGWIKLLGIKWRRRNHRPVDRIDKTGWLEAVKNGLREGRRQADIARELNIKPHTMSRFVKENGLKIYAIGRRVSK